VEEFLGDLGVEVKEVSAQDLTPEVDMPWLLK